MAVNKKNLQASGNTSSANRGRRSGSGKGLQTKIIKSNRTVKGRRIAHKQFYNTGTAIPRVGVRFGGFRIVAQANARITANQLEAVRRTLKKFLTSKKLGLSITAYPFAPVTRRPSDVRMGKGKGTRISSWICPIRKGQVLFDFALSEPGARGNLFGPIFRGLLAQSLLSSLKLVRIKLPIPVRFFQTVQ